MEKGQTSFRTDNCDGCTGDVGVAHCRMEEFVETIHGERVLNTQHQMLCKACRDAPRPREPGAKTEFRLVNLRSEGA